MADEETKTLKLNLDPDGYGLKADYNHGLYVDLYTPDNEHPYQSLHFTTDGKLASRLGNTGETGEGEPNKAGNGIGDPAIKTGGVPILGANKTVSRHKSYTGDDSDVKTNDGVVMAKLDANGEIIGGLAYEILRRW